MLRNASSIASKDLAAIPQRESGNPLISSAVPDLQTLTESLQPNCRRRASLAKRPRCTTAFYFKPVASRFAKNTIDFRFIGDTALNIGGSELMQIHGPFF